VTSAILVALTLTAGGAGTEAGAKYVALSPPVLAIVPTLELPPEIPFTLQVTPGAGLPALEIVAEKS